MKFGELKDNILICEWMDTLNPAKSTERLYLWSMQEYTDFTEMTPEELLNEAEEEIKKGILMRQRKIKSHLVGFRKHLQTKGMADLSVKTRLTGVRSFYKSFDIEIPNIQGERRRARVVEENKAIPEKADLQECLKVCDPIEKAVVLTGVSSGLASNEIRNLKIKVFKKGFDPETGITTLKLTRRKVGFDFITFLTPEASQAVWEYLSFRDRYAKAATNRRNKQLEKQRIVNDEGFLFIRRNFTDEFLDTQDEELRKLTENAILKMYHSISEKAKKNTKKGFFNMIRSHTMRKYFNSALLNAGCDSFHVEFFMGHTLDDTRAAYFRAKPEDLKKIYQKYIPYLTIQSDLDISKSKEFKNAIDERDHYKSMAQKLLTDNLELINLKADIARDKARLLTTEQKKDAVLDWLNKSPDNPNMERLQAELKKVLG